MKIWSKHSTWDFVLPPSRPDDFQLGLIRETVLKYDSSTICVGILGSTPEFRDLLYELNVKNIIVFDKSEDFYKKMSDYRIYTNSEIFVKGNWLNTLPEYNNYFDILLSDLTAGNVPYSERKKFYSLIAQSLKSNGRFIDKYLTNENGLLSLNEIDRKYSNLSINFININNFSCEAIFCSELQKEKAIIDTTCIYKKLKNRFQDNKRILKFIELAHFITPENCVWYYGKDSTDYIDLSLEKKCDLVKNSAYYDRAWLFFWKK
jgi:hypothetical protein